MNSSKVSTGMIDWLVLRTIALAPYIFYSVVVLLSHSHVFARVRPNRLASCLVLQHVIAQQSLGFASFATSSTCGCLRDPILLCSPVHNRMPGSAFVYFGENQD